MGLRIGMKLQWPEVTTFWVYNNQIIIEDTDVNYLSGKEYNEDE